MAILDFLKKQIKIYDPSENRVILGGLELDSVTRIAVQIPVLNKMVEGTHPSYSTIVRAHQMPAMVQVDIMPSATTLPKILELYQYVKVYGVFFDLEVVRSGEQVLLGSATFERKYDYTLANESLDYTFTFIVNLFNSPTENSLNAGVFDLTDFPELFDNSTGEQ